MTRLGSPRFATLAVALALVLLASACGSATEERALPDVELERLGAQGTLTVNDPVGPTVYNLWATWCAPCRAELPAFDAVAARTTDVEIIGVNVGDTGPDAGELVAELELRFPQVLDPTARIQRGLRIPGLPATIFVDSEGDVLSVHNGELTEEELDELIDENFRS
ncbi:MAG: TlpA disulfide reductase family protein [Actinomycetota bacterium]